VVQADGRAFLTNATVGGRFALRACVLHYGTSESDLELLVRAVREAGGAASFMGGPDAVAKP